MQNSNSETTKTIKKSKIELHKTSNQAYMNIKYFDICKYKIIFFFKYVPLYFVCMYPKKRIISQGLNNHSESTNTYLGAYLKMLH